MSKALGRSKVFEENILHLLKCLTERPNLIHVLQNVRHKIQVLHFVGLKEVACSGSGEKV